MTRVNNWLDGKWWNKKIEINMIINIYNKSMIINIIIKKMNVAQVFWVQFLVIKDNYSMTNLSLMISNMSFVTNEWNVSHHVVNNYCSKKLVHNDFKAINHFVL